ncbi:cysteine hydrolase family protein [Bacillus spongiae]|uniref:Cysteine hydrolase family protein n=1 Tax=Bacillus spongiae TaxID=2683610 RepID=A0ABU8HKC4_9BACI
MKNKSALLIIDVQSGMFPEEEPVYKGSILLHTIGNLITKAKKNDLPIIYIQHNGPTGHPLEVGTKGWTIHPEIAEESSIVIQKTTPDSFFQTELEKELTKRGITDLFFTGIQTDYCVDTTCRRAFSLGYNSTLVTDAHSTWDSGGLTAQQIINHHNKVLSSFAKLKASKDVEF